METHLIPDMMTEEGHQETLPEEWVKSIICMAPVLLQWLEDEEESEELLEESELDEEEDEYLTKHKTIKACEMQEFLCFNRSLKYLVKSV
ncbi:hypothetical protein TREES_T100019555 [Tupaia chinensis]|uniref:Uncharacterized protein n=1 Tax=Tupaia chinensis TaxID=246437 RepID=L9K2E2_TUPCH|nr:hypothetical protein TREES_T100019555 [Tupaia chinensis]